MDAEELRRASAGVGAEQAAGERRIADRLDALEAERVLARAIELDQASLRSDEPTITLTAEQLERVAAEIGVDPAFVHQALGEVRLGEDDRSRLDRLILPERLAESVTLNGLARDEAERFVNRYLREYEGLVEEHRRPDGIDWNVDSRLGSRVRTSLATGNNRVSRATGDDLAHRLRTVGEDTHVVTLQSEGERPLAVAKLGLALAAFIVLGGVVGALGLGIGWFLQAVAGSVITGAAVAAGSVWAARNWAGNIRRALRRSMTRLGDLAERRSRPSSSPPDPDERRSRWRR